MMKMLRIAFDKVRLLAAVSFIAGATYVFVPGTSAAFSAGSLTGGKIVTTGTYNVNPGGGGSLSLTWNTATGDADGDTTCSGLNAAAITQHTDLVVEAGGNAFDIQEQDDFLSAPSITTDSDVQSPFVGTCKKQ
jgi:hypothetical protein